MVEGLGRVQHDRDETAQGQESQYVPGRGSIGPNVIVALALGLIGAVVGDQGGRRNVAPGDALFAGQHDGVVMSGLSWFYFCFKKVFYHNK